MLNDSVDTPSLNHNLKVAEQEKNIEMSSKIRYFTYFISTLFFASICLYNISIQQESQIVAQKEVYSLFDPIETNRSCQLIDSYDGNLDYLNNAFESSQFTFIYLYADWCARSLKFRKLIKKLACKYSHTMSFIAVNCFNPTGSCRKNFDLTKYPHIVLQIRNVGLYDYQGPFEINYISQYLDFITSPLSRIDTLEEFADFVIQNDGAVIGNFDFEKKYDNKLFSIFYQSAIKTYHTNFNNPIRYGVIVDKRLRRRVYDLEYKLSHLNEADKKIMLFSVYGLSKFYQLSSQNISVDSLTIWAKSNIRRTLKWHYPDKFPINSESRDQLLIFMDRHPPVDISDGLNRMKKKFAIMKYIAIENRLSKMNYKSVFRNNNFLNMIMIQLESIFSKRPVCCTKRVFPMQRKKFPDIEFCDKSSKTTYKNIPFMKNFDIYLIDRKLYRTYASYLLNGSTSENGNKPTILYMDFKNESLYSLDNRFTYQNLRRFIIDQSNGLNKRNIKSYHKQAIQSNLFENIDSKQLASIFDNNHINKNYYEKDLMVMYYANWCGHCKIFNFKLIKLMHQYFSNVKSIKLLKINTDYNDIPWQLEVDKIPSLLFIPANFELTGSKKNIETVAFNNLEPLSTQSLLKFILTNARNPVTILDFFKENLIASQALNNHKSSTQRNELSEMFMNLIASKLKTLDTHVSALNKKLSLFSHDNQFNVNMSPAENHANTTLNGSIYNTVYANNIKAFLMNKLEESSKEMDFLQLLKS